MDPNPICTLGSPLNSGNILWFSEYVYLFLCNVDYSIANYLDIHMYDANMVHHKTDRALSMHLAIPSNIYNTRIIHLQMI